MKKIGDLLGVGLVGISLYILTGIKLIGIVGAVITLIVELYVLFEKTIK